MTSRDFVFWLQGYLEIHGAGPIREDQARLIAAHLDLVFKHDPAIDRKKMEHPAVPTIPKGPSFPQWHETLPVWPNPNATCAC